MIYTGMIYQYDSEQGNGLIMLSDGEKKEFSVNEWVDTENEPEIAQKIAYETDGNSIRIRVATEEDIKRAEEDAQKEDIAEEESASSENSEQFNSVDECIEHFTAMGFKQVRTKSDDITLRSYVMGDFAEVLIKQNGSKISVSQTLNGQPVT